jgi:tetratricopeptide (TPR) repeat protein
MNQKNKNVITPWKILFAFFKASVMIFLIISISSAFIQKSKSNKSTKTLTAQKYIQQKNYTKAIALLEPMLRDNPRANPEAYLMLALCKINIGEKEKAIELSEKGLKYFPNSNSLQEFYVSLLNDSLTKREAKAKLEERYKESPTSPIYLKALSHILLLEETPDPRLDQMLSSLSKAFPTDPEVHYIYGQWACINNKEKLCVEELTKALNLTSPSNNLARMQIYTLMGRAEAKLGHVVQAEAAFKNALTINRKLPKPDPYGGFLYVKFLLESSRLQEANDVIDEIIRWAPTFGPARFEKAKLLAKQSKYIEAIEEAELALKYFTGNNQSQLHAIHAFLAKTYFSVGQEEKSKLHQDWIEANQVTESK